MSNSAAGAEKRLRAEIRRDLTAFARFVLADQGYAPALHHLAILAELERLSRGEISRLMLLLPPGSAKSTYASLIFPAWWLARNPGKSVIAASHTAGLAEHFGRGVRGLLTEHSARLGCSVRQDARAASRFLTAEGGDYFAVGVGGAVTGRRADLAVLDDPIRSFADVDSMSARERLWSWYRSELVTRLKPAARVVLAMTRWHRDDLAGRLLAQGNWSVLRLPALAEDGDPLGRDVGGVLWPDWEDRAAILGKRETLGETQFAALFQQAPEAEGGKLFDVSKFVIVDTVPEGASVRAWDLAGSVNEARDPDWTVGLRLLKDSAGLFYVEDVCRFRAVPDEVAQRIRRVAEADGYQVVVGLPRDPGQAGLYQIEVLTRSLAGWRVASSPEQGSKERRTGALQSQVNNGNLRLRRASWNEAFLDELARFPGGKKDDQVDALSRAFSMLVEATPAARYVSLPFLAR